VAGIHGGAGHKDKAMLLVKLLVGYHQAGVSMVLDGINENLAHITAINRYREMALAASVVKSCRVLDQTPFSDQHFKLRLVYPIGMTAVR